VLIGLAVGGLVGGDAALVDNVAAGLQADVATGNDAALGVADATFSQQ